MRDGFVLPAFSPAGAPAYSAHRQGSFSTCHPRANGFAKASLSIRGADKPVKRPVNGRS